jgi:hypothetical protein
MVQIDELTIVQLGHLVYFDMVRMDHRLYGNRGDRGNHGRAASQKPIKTGNNTTMDTFYNNHQVQRLLQSHGQCVRDYMDPGWHGYFLSFMFSQIPGSDASRLQEMKKHLGWFYGRLAKASVPKASRPEWSEFLPKMVLAPDLPVPKRSKVQLRDVTINNGLHWHGLMVVNPLAPKLQTGLDDHIRQNLAKYLVGHIREIDVNPITCTPEYVTGYGLKSLKSRFSMDEILIFPRTVTELPSNGPYPRRGPVRAAGEKPTYDFQRE